MSEQCMRPLPLRAAVLAAIDAEPELPGAIPPGVARAVKADPEKVLRATAIATKRNIRARVLAVLDTHHRQETDR